MTDPEKLRALADWFDLRDVGTDGHSDEVQQDLRRIADELIASRDSRILSAVPSDLPDLLDELIEYFEPMADADASGDPLEFKGNKEMHLLTQLEKIKRGIAG